MRRERDDEIQALLASLPPKDRSTVVMRYWYDLSYEEIAAATTTTVSAVKSRLHRARCALAPLVNPSEIVPPGTTRSPQQAGAGALPPRHLMRGAQAYRTEKTVAEIPMNTVQLIFAFLGRLLAFVIALILCVPVILLPPATAVPAWAWIPLAAADVALLVLFFRLQPAWKGAAVSLAGVLLVGVLAVVASQAFAKTPPITDSQGNPLPGSIATLEKVTLNGSQQWISIRGKDTSKPVLLLPGGRAGRQPTDHRALRPGRAGGSFRRRQLGAARRGQILRRRGSHHTHSGALHRGRPRPGHAAARTLRAGKGLRAGRIVGQRARASARPALPRGCSTPSSAPDRWWPSSKTT